MAILALTIDGEQLSANDDDIDQLDVAGYAEEDVIFNDYVRVIGGLRGSGAVRPRRRPGQGHSGAGVSYSK